MASSSTSVKMMTTPTTVTTFGPAGTPLNLRESGANILDTFCNSYPDTETHSLLPNFFGDNITELMEPRENLSRREEDQFRGRLINQVGEGHELVVYNIFVRLIRQKDISPTLLIMRTFEMDTKNPMNLNLKRNALQSLLPSIKLKSINTQAENDFVVLVQNVGVVCIETKGSTKDNMVRSAEKQLTNVNKIIQSIMKAMTNDEKRIIPTVRLIIVPDCTDETPSDPTPLGSYFVFNNMCENFEEKWEKVIKELHRIKYDNPFTPEEYKELCQILVGIWSAKPVPVTQPGARTYELKQEETNVSLVRQLEKIDKAVDTSDIRNESHFKLPEEKLNPFTAICRTDESDIFHSCNNLKLCYLTPAQKQLFSQQKQAIVRSPAGCGKSLLILFKTLELVSDSKLSCAILILAPVPHTIRIKNALQANNISVDVIEQFPPPSTSCKAFIMDVKKFFKVERTTLMSYDMSGYHVFVDDLQQLKFEDNKHYGGTSFFDVGDFIDQTYRKSVDCDRYLWVMMDLAQGDLRDLDDVDDVGALSQDLFLTHDNKPRTYNIPTVTLLHVMRNTHHIIKLTNEARNERVNLSNISSLTFPSPQEGHKVTSNTPVRHKLKYGTKDKHKGQFIVTRLREVLETVTTPPYSLPLSNVAVIYEFEDWFKPYKDEVVSFLINEFGTTPQTIEQQLTNNNTADIIMDEYDNIMSFESTVVVYINLYGLSRLYYNICTRARVSLTVIDVDSVIDETYKNMDVVQWKPDGSGNFTKYNASDTGSSRESDNDSDSDSDSDRDSDSYRDSDSDNDNTDDTDGDSKGDSDSDSDSVIDSLQTSPHICAVEA